MAHLLRKYAIAPTDFILFRSVGATNGRPHKINGENQTKRERTEEIQNAVGAGALDSPLYINVFSGRRRRRPLPRYRETVHFFSAKRVCEHNTGGASPSPTEIERDRSFVRRRKVVRTRIRTPHPSAFGCHLPPLGKAFAKCEHRLKPNDSANNVTGDQWSPLQTKFL